MVYVESITTNGGTMYATPTTIEQLQSNQAEAEALGAKCPHCGETAHVDASHRQATRQQPCQFLGVTLYCECAADFMSGRGMVGHIPADDLLLAYA